MTTDKKNIKIEQIKLANRQKRSGYVQNEVQRQKLAEFKDLFEKDKQARNSDVKRYFNERSLEEYLDDNQKRVNSYIEPRSDDPDDWKTRYRSLLSRNKMLAFLSKLATIRMKMKFKDKAEGGDQQKLRALNALYNHYQDLDNWDMKQFKMMWNAWQDGTVFTYIAPKKEFLKQKEITKWDSETGEYEALEKILIKWRVNSKIIPLQDIWFGNIRETDVQEQPHLWLRFEYDYQDFWKEWGKFKNAKYVTVTTSGSKENDTFFRGADMKDEQVELLFYLNKWEDRMVIWANEVELYDGPLPFGDKEGKWYPGEVGQGELIATDFIYGKSGADKLAQDQDLRDLFLRMLADRVRISANPAWLEEGDDNLPEEIQVGPGTRNKVDNLEKVREIAFADTSSQLINVIKVFTEEANLTGGADVMQGVTQPGRTATAEMIAEKSVQQLVGLSQFFMEDFMKRMALIYIRTILAGMNIPEKTKGRMKNGQPKIDEMDFGTFTERNTIIPDDGSRGDIVWKMVGSSKELKEEDEIDMREIVAKTRGRNIKIYYITPDYFDDVLTEVEPVIGSSTEQSPALKKAMQQEFLNGFIGFFPELFAQNKAEFAKDYLEVWEKDIDRLLGEGASPMVNPMLSRIGVMAQTTRQAQNMGVPNELQRMMR
ncbi:MAG: hypothetical protein ACOZAL_01045 [Patescibacteria group bacterium]